jgi:GGDEF domain-containing protein
MGLFEKALTYSKKKGLYHRLLELQKEKEKEPKSLYLKAKLLREQLQNSPNKEELKLPDYTIEEISPKEKDPEIAKSQLIEKDVDPFVDWEKEAIEEIQKSEKEQEDVKQKIIEDESEILTLPEEIHVASQKRIDYYLALFDILEEFQEIEEYEELLESIAFSIQEQLGTRSILVLGNSDLISDKKGSLFYLLDVGYKSIEITIREDDPFLIYLSKFNAGEIFYTSKLKELLQKDLKDSVLTKHKEILEEFTVYFSLKNSEKIYAIYFLSTPLEQKDYILDDLEFLRVLIKLSITRLKQLQKQYQIKHEIQNIKEFSEYANSFFKFIVDVSSKKTLDDVYDSIQSFLEERFRITMFSFVIIHIEENAYKLFSGKNISYESLNKFKIHINGDLIGLISNLTTVQELENFKDYKEIVDNYTEEDLAIMEHFIIVPLIHLNWLIGFFAIHKFKGNTLTESEKELLLYFATMVSPIITNMIINQERELLFKDTFSPLKKRLEQEINKSEELKTSFSLINLRIKNLKRLLGVNTILSMDKYLRQLIEVINGTLYQHDYFVRLGQGNFILLLSGRGKEESQIYVKKLLNKIKDKNIFQESPVQPNFSYDIYTYPYDADNLKKMLALIES